MSSPRHSVGPESVEARTKKIGAVYPAFSYTKCTRRCPLRGVAVEAKSQGDPRALEDSRGQGGHGQETRGGDHLLAVNGKMLSREDLGSRGDLVGFSLRRSRE